ncbi:tetratricopeptide repeat protein 33-like [Tropilaelaps mercedesae]|uniref:Tetratricopeptide repeat protein 33-like n=1 Tax=Tropilaelaps mercedesae TaxID=418985 RepID=A0A1V9XP01_9ACAR|nr:tetratricopeptide repeat protein 33-like [Tropilaelaps mercedesae]
MWKKRTPRLGASCLGSDEDDEEAAFAMDIPVETKWAEPGAGYGDKLTIKSEATRNNRKRIASLSEEEYRSVVDRLESICQKELWGSALKLVDELIVRRCDEKVLEMKAQILIGLCRDYDAIRCCEGAIKLNPLWWEAHQTHGRALLAFGEPRLAMRAFQRAIRLNPADEDLREELNWVRRSTEGSIPADGCDFTKLVKKR